MAAKNQLAQIWNKITAKFVLQHGESLRVYVCLRRAFLNIMRKHDVICYTGSTKHIATPPVDDRATAAGYTHRKFDGNGS